MCEAAHARVRQRMIMYLDLSRITDCVEYMTPAKRLQFAKRLARVADDICGLGSMEVLKRRVETAARKLTEAADAGAKLPDAAEALRIVSEVLICRPHVRTQRLMKLFEAKSRPRKPVASGNATAIADDGTRCQERSPDEKACV